MLKQRKEISTVTLSHSAAPARFIPSVKTGSIPWYIWFSVTAAACIMSGLYWDISWHETIGRDTFWTPAHLLIQFGAVLAGIYSAYLIFSTTFGNDPGTRRTSVNVLGFRGPLGAFICASVARTSSTPAPSNT